MLGGRSRWLERCRSSRLGKSRVLPRQRGETWFWRKKTSGQTRKFWDFPTLGSEREGRTTDTVRLGRIHCTHGERSVVASRQGREDGGDGGQLYATAHGALRRSCGGACIGPASRPHRDECAARRGDLTGGENDTNPPVGRGGIHPAGCLLLLLASLNLL
jgi:hypothetical protein